MGYEQNPLNVLKGQMTNKAVGLGHGNSMAMQTDPKDGVVVTGKDKSKSASEARAERLAKRDKELADKKMQMKIARENRRMELELKRETQRAAYGAKRQRAEQKLKKRRGQISENSEDTSTNYTGGPLNQMDPKDGSKKSKKTQDPGERFHYAGGDQTIRQSFNKAYKEAKEGGYDTFRFSHSGVKGDDNKYKFKSKIYTTK
jgi:hypothetical protein